jgi:putative endonuclease
MKPGADPTRPSRRRAHLFGLRAEFLAATLLICKGYRIIERRYGLNGGEIDIIARRGGTVAFVEVKARGDIDDAASAISETKRRRISRAARLWVTRNSWSMSENLRGDAIFVAPGRLPRHLPSAYTLDID